MSKRKAPRTLMARMKGRIWQPTEQHLLAWDIVGRLEWRLNSWRGDITQRQQLGEDVSGRQAYLREIVADLEASRKAAMPTPRPGTRSIVDWLKEKEQDHSA